MDGNDHHMDALNGFLASRPMDVKWSAAKELANESDWDIEADMNAIGSHSSHMAY
jgi:hypothetical protein